MFFHTLNAEWTKLRTTKGLWWNLVIYFILVLGFLALQVYGAMDTNKRLAAEGLPKAPVDVSSLMDVIAQGGGLMLMIIAITAITTEYGHKYAPVTFQAVPGRLTVAFAKFLLLTILSIALTLLSAGIGWLMFRGFVGSDSMVNLAWSNAAFRRSLWVTPLYTVLLVALSQAVAWLLRNSSGTIVIMLVWYMVLEIMVIPMLPKVGEKIHPYGPLSNLGAFLHNTDLAGTPWDIGGSLLYFLAWVVVLYVSAMVLLKRRDA